MLILFPACLCGALSSATVVACNCTYSIRLLVVYFTSFIKFCSWYPLHEQVLTVWCVYLAASKKKTYFVYICVNEAKASFGAQVTDGRVSCNSVWVSRRDTTTVVASFMTTSCPRVHARTHYNHIISMAPADEGGLANSTCCLLLS